MYNIIPNYIDRNKLIINHKNAYDLNINNKKRIYLKYGLNLIEIDIVLSKEIDVNELSLSINIINDLNIYLNSIYEIRNSNNILTIGPYIGILAFHTKEGLNNNINSLSNYIYHYLKIGGSILAFSLEGINRDKQLIEGYLYDYKLNKWIFGNYKYPSVIFKRISINKEWRNILVNLYEHKLFNDYTFNKWEMYNYLNQFKNLRSFLPDTSIYQDYQDINTNLDIHKNIYIKPINGSQGLNIIKVNKTDSGILIYMNNNEIALYNKNEIIDFFKNTLKKDKYRIQKTVDLHNDKGQIIDFRLVIIKNEDGKWEDMGMIARTGNINSIVSNISNGGLAEKSEIIIKKHLNINEKESFIKRNIMSNIGIAIAKSIEECGINCGNLGIDLGIDKKGKIWLIEVNNKDPNHTIAIDAEDRQMFYKIKMKNMLYCKYLDGFRED